MTAPTSPQPQPHAADNLTSVTTPTPDLEARILALLDELHDLARKQVRARAYSDALTRRRNHKIIEAVAQGVSQGECCRIFGLDKGYVSRVVAAGVE